MSGAGELATGSSTTGSSASGSSASGSSATGSSPLGRLALAPAPGAAFGRPLFLPLTGPGLAAAADADLVGHAVRGDGRAHAPVPLHLRGDARRALEIA